MGIPDNIILLVHFEKMKGYKGIPELLGSFAKLENDGWAILQVPIDESLPETVEYAESRVDELLHVRRYGWTIEILCKK